MEDDISELIPQTEASGTQDSTSAGGKASKAVSVINILNSIIGIGVMTLPYSLRINGYLLGFFIFIVCAAMAHIAFLYLSNASA